jgi:RNA polymerase sigma factor (sigma-70 family)
MNSNADEDAERRPGLPRSAVLDTLVRNHREFLAFLERRVGDRDLAEDLLQDAFVRGIDKIGALRQSDSARAWFYRTLRNAIVDASRRRDVADRRLAALRSELDDAAASDTELARIVCACVSRLASTLKPEYSQVLERVEVDGIPVADYAKEVGISESNAGVRAFRARAALRREVERSCGTCAEHGCVDCSCRRH